MTSHSFEAIATRRQVLAATAGVAGLAMMGASSTAIAAAGNSTFGANTMDTIKTKDGVSIFFKDLGPKNAQALVFHHGWPLSSDDWDAQVLFFLAQGYRVIAHDRRGHGRSTQTVDGNEMDTYAADVAALTDALDLKGAIHIGHSTGGGEVAHYVARAKPGRVSKAVLIGAVPPVMVKSEKNPDGHAPRGLRRFARGAGRESRAVVPRSADRTFLQLQSRRRESRQGSIYNWWRQGMMGGAKAHYDCIKAFSETDFTDDLKKIEVPTLLMHGTDDQIVPIADSAELGIKLLKKGTLKKYDGFPHGMATTHADVINKDLLAFFNSVHRHRDQPLRQQQPRVLANGFPAAGHHRAGIAIDCERGRERGHCHGDWSQRFDADRFQRERRGIAAGHDARCRVRRVLRHADRNGQFQFHDHGDQFRRCREP